MIVIPEIQIKGGKLVTRQSLKAEPIIHDISPIDAAHEFASAEAEILQVLDYDAARGEPSDNAETIKEILKSCGAQVQVGGGIRTLTQVGEWFEAGAARVVLGTVAITDAGLVAEAAGRHPGGILVHLATRNGIVVINGWNTETSFRPQDLIHDLQMTGIAGIIHKDIDRFEGDSSESLALTEELSHDVSIPVYSSGTVDTLDDIARLHYLPNINGAIVSHALVNGAFTLEQALRVVAEKPTGAEPESSTPVFRHGIYKGVRAYLAAYNNSQAARAWNQALRDTITADNPYMELLIPQLDLEIDTQSMSVREVHRCYELEIEKADIVIVVLEGVENKAWTGFECGYARALGKYIYGISGTQDVTNKRRQDWLAEMCDELICYTVSDEVTASLSQISHELSSRVLTHAA